MLGSGGPVVVESGNTVWLDSKQPNVALSERLRRMDKLAEHRMTGFGQCHAGNLI